ncbi:MULTISPECIES: nucleotidyltransferase domain-containing protein [unclassified Lysobacter]|uniref:DNA polymerase beta superfamily protein n=1 Tax=unclassified Lysobacter TaxID=2635362 RepID=UPI001BEA8D9F|nr:MULTISPECIES: nucleotidyltransferase domain-containing protein [unclassified Lysobacter]MBT2748418.1 hypothetical protein [Lysobacter sp. ISL-42]MBT2749815.1 hypothetical protein [Lysobacter sp. ISL-50]MBT2781143.1 hypothetical protein [Lysobacter sp. ISL-52]
MSDPAHPHDIPPVSDAKRRAVLDALASIDALLVRKRLSAEVAAGPRIAAISDFLEAQIERMQALQPQLPAGTGRGERLDEFFRSALA